MSLLNDAMTPVVLLKKGVRPDGEGGSITTWTEGEPFHAAITVERSSEIRVAGKPDETTHYTVMTPKAVVLGYHDVFRRLSDGKIFRVTSKGDDKHTPDRASFHVRQVTAEEWVMA